MFKAVSRMFAGCAIAAVAAMAAPASAAVTYSFVGSGDFVGITFSFSQADFVTNAQNVSAFTVKTGGFGSVDFCFDGQFGGNCRFGTPGYSLLGFNFSGSSFYVAYDGTPFQADGIYRSSSGSGQSGALTISGAPGAITPPSTPAVPEPATWAMLVLGMGAVGHAMRRRHEVAGTETRAI